MARARRSWSVKPCCQLATSSIRSIGPQLLVWWLFEGVEPAGLDLNRL